MMSLVRFDATSRQRFYSRRMARAVIKDITTVSNRILASSVEEDTTGLEGPRCPTLNTTELYLYFSELYDIAMLPREHDLSIA